MVAGLKLRFRFSMGKNGTLGASGTDGGQWRKQFMSAHQRNWRGSSEPKVSFQGSLISRVVFFFDHTTVSIWTCSSWAGWRWWIPWSFISLVRTREGANVKKHLYKRLKIRMTNFPFIPIVSYLRRVWFQFSFHFYFLSLGVCIL